ncbi:MAG: GNAT family N-acetyltransferase [Syntrophobacteraceae bacterium]|nr:GNAT family N-acetyltransferase [Syntrophobacteraceae bacterium]
MSTESSPPLENPKMTPPLTRIVNDEAEFCELRDPWNHLLKTSTADTVYLTWEWSHTWWEIFKEEKELFIILVEEGGRLIGIAPFYLSKSRFFGLRNLRHVELLGSTDVCSEYLDLIILKGREPEVVCAVLNCLYRKQYRKWDVLNIVSMLEDSPNWQWIKGYLRLHGHDYGVYDSREHLYIQLPDTMDEYMQMLDGKMREGLRRKQKKLMRKYSINLTKQAICEDIVSHFVTFLDLHAKRWSVKEGVIHAKNRSKHLAFHKKIVNLFCDNGWLCLVFLKANEQTLAGQYDFVYGGTLYYHSVAFDPDWAHYSPGSVLLLMVLENAIEKKFSKFDFLRGMEDYKAHWAKTSCRLVDAVVWRSSATRSVTNMERKIRKSVKSFVPVEMGHKLYNRFFAGSS